tara:strand:+ start:9293 stop:11578 length:2286 start_codon:yes stop_codon:yes gene_type:complete
MDICKFLRNGFFAQSVSVGILTFALLSVSVTAVQETSRPNNTENNSENEDKENPPLTFLDSVTVSATLNPSPLRETPGHVSVITGEDILDSLAENLQDVVKYEPGVYIENDITRFGLNGFNIRGVGGNRVMTQVDGVQISEQFDFGPFNVHQTSLDIDTLKSLEIVRSANSALYGSDALGGVVSLFTKDPLDYLGNRNLYVGAKTTWNSRADDFSGNLTVAGGNNKIQGSLFASVMRGNEFKNQGTVDANDASRTVPNPQDRLSRQFLAKAVFTASPGNVIRVSGESFETQVDTNIISQLDTQLLYGFMLVTTSKAEAVDNQDRWRLSLDHSLAGRGGLDLLTWNIYGQANQTSQVVDQTRTTIMFGPPTTALRNGIVDFDQRGVGGSVQGQKWIGPANQNVFLTFGASVKRDHFDMIRDRSEVNLVTGAPVYTSLIFPSKYFPQSNVTERGIYVQAEVQMGRITFVPGLRYDDFSLDADQEDQIFLSTLSPEPADFSADAISPKIGASVKLSEIFTLHGQYSGGFRAPPYSDINSGFTNLQSGYTTLPNASLDAETSDNIEAGLRASFGRSSFSATGFSNQYDNFIELTTKGFNPFTGLLEFQSQNIAQVEIKGIEFRAEAFITDAIRIRGSYAAISGSDVSDNEETPLDSIAPNEGVIGLQYLAPSGRWTGELSLRFVQSQDQENAEDNQYLPEAYQVLDAVGSISLTDKLTLRLGAFNLTDSTYFEWWNVRGRSTEDPLINRYSSPGISVITSLAYDW